jgi:hypothetical protein
MMAEFQIVRGMDASLERGQNFKSSINLSYQQLSIPTNILYILFLCLKLYSHCGVLGSVWQLMER